MSTASEFRPGAPCCCRPCFGCCSRHRFGARAKRRHGGCPACRLCGAVDMPSAPARPKTRRGRHQAFGCSRILGRSASNRLDLHCRVGSGGSLCFPPSEAKFSAKVFTWEYFRSTVGKRRSRSLAAFGGVCDEIVCLTPILQMSMRARKLENGEPEARNRSIFRRFRLKGLRSFKKSETAREKITHPDGSMPSAKGC